VFFSHCRRQHTTTATTMTTTTTYGRGRLQACARGALPSTWRCCKVCFCALVTNSFVERHSRQSIYVLVSKHVVSFWGLRPQIPTGTQPLDHAGGPRTPNLPTPEKNQKYLCIIFKTCRQLLGASPHIPTGIPPLDHAGGPRTPICPPLKKIQRAPMAIL